MPIDVRTLSLASALAVLSVAGAMTYVWGRRKTYDGFGLWTASAWCTFGGMVFLTLRDHVQDHLAIHGASALLNLAGLLLVAGLYAFRGQRAPFRWLFLAYGLDMALSLAFHDLVPNAALRIATHAFFTGGICLWAAVLAWPPLPQVPVRPNGLLRYTLLALGLVYVARGLATLALPPGGTPLITPWVLHHSALVAYLLGQTALFTGLLVLNGQRVEQDLEHSLEEYRKLRGLIPICSACKKIRDDQGDWDPLESYLHQHAGVDFTHGLCPDCAAAFRT